MLLNYVLRLVDSMGMFSEHHVSDSFVFFFLLGDLVELGLC